MIFRFRLKPLRGNHQHVQLYTGLKSTSTFAYLGMLTFRFDEWARFRFLLESSKSEDKAEFQQEVE